MQRVGQWVSEGLPITKDGKVDLAKGDKWVSEHLDPEHRELAKAPKRSVADRRATKLDRETELLALRVAAQRGELIQRAAVLGALSSFAALHRDAWLGFVPRAVPDLVAAGADHANVRIGFAAAAEIAWQRARGSGQPERGRLVAHTSESASRRADKTYLEGGSGKP